MSNPAAWIEPVARLAREAGALILQVYARDFAVRGKADASPVTEADEIAEACIVAGLHALAPAVPVVAEEAAARGEAPAPGARFWLVDPLDGTREFVSRNGEFTVNIALVEDGLPVLGVVHVPVQDTLYAGVVGRGAWVEEEGEGGRRSPLVCQPAPPEGLRLACSRSHGDEPALQAWLAGRPVASRVAAGSSLKFGLLARGRADVYPRLGRTMEWDTAAGHAVLRAAGGEVRDLRGAVLRYGKPGFENPHFVAWGAA
jgi:3'(2'), 5'-bisphosphate nucleotidase